LLGLSSSYGTSTVSLTLVGSRVSTALFTSVLSNCSDSSAPGVRRGRWGGPAGRFPALPRGAARFGARGHGSPHRPAKHTPPRRPPATAPSAPAAAAPRP